MSDEEEQKKQESNWNWYNKEIEDDALKYYSQTPEWTVEDFNALILGKDPNKIHLGTLEKFKNYYFIDGSVRNERDLLIKKYNQHQELIDRGISCNKLSLHFWRLDPLDCINWAKKEDIKLPTKLEKMVKKYHSRKKGPTIMDTIIEDLENQKEENSKLKNFNIDMETRYKVLYSQYQKSQSTVAILQEEKAKLIEKANTTTHHKRLKSWRKGFISMVSANFGLDKVLNRKVSYSEISIAASKQGVKIDEGTIKELFEDSIRYVNSKE